MPNPPRLSPQFMAGLLALSLSPLAPAGHALASDDRSAVSAEAYVTETCMECHGGAAMGDERIAPPMFAAKNHYKDLTNKQDFVEVLSAYLQAPSEDAARMPGAIKKFGLMPDLDLDAETADAIAAFIWETDFNEPEWYRQHYEEEHGKAPDQ